MTVDDLLALPRVSAPAIDVIAQPVRSVTTVPQGFEGERFPVRRAFDGTFEHQDSNGGGGTITNGDTQWMTAGGGVLHIEKPPEAFVVSGGRFHGFHASLRG